MFWSALAVVYGAFAALFPERAIDYCSRFTLVGFENPEDLEPSEWYLSFTRVTGSLLAVTGVVAIALEVVFSKRLEEKSE